MWRDREHQKIVFNDLLRFTANIHDLKKSMSVDTWCVQAFLFYHIFFYMNEPHKSQIATGLSTGSSIIKKSNTIKTLLSDGRTETAKS